MFCNKLDESQPIAISWPKCGKYEKCVKKWNNNTYVCVCVLEQKKEEALPPEANLRVFVLVVWRSVAHKLYIAGQPTN